MLSEWSTQTQMVVRFQTSANANIKENCLTGYLCSLLFVWYELFVIDLKAFYKLTKWKKAFIFHTLIWMHQGEVFPNPFKAHGFWFGILLFLSGKGRATYLVAGLYLKSCYIMKRLAWNVECYRTFHQVRFSGTMYYFSLLCSFWLD